MSLSVLIMKSLINCKLVKEFDDNSIENIETIYFYNTDFINIMFIILFQEYINLVMFLMLNT